MVDTSLLIVCGLKAEADIAIGADGSDPRVTLLAGGGDAQQLERRLGRLAPRASAVLSFGVAGGLAPDLVAGNLLVADALATPDGRVIPTDADWAAALATRLGAQRAIFAAVDAPLADIAGKAKLHRSTGAATVDMETHIAARAAVAHGLRLAAIRVVTDAASRSLPHVATVGMRSDGKVDGAAIARSLLRDPRQIPALIRTGLDARKAFAALLRCRETLGPGFALFDL